LLAHGGWFSPGTQASTIITIITTGRHDIAEIMLKVASSTKINQSIIAWQQGIYRPLLCQ